MVEYQEEMGSLTKKRLKSYRKKLEESKEKLEAKIVKLEKKKEKRRKFGRTENVRTFLSNSAENLTLSGNEERISSSTVEKFDGILSFSNENLNLDDRTIIRPKARYSASNRRNEFFRDNLTKLKALTESQQEILDETDRLVNDSRNLRDVSASEFELARETLLSR